MKIHEAERVRGPCFALHVWHGYTPGRSNPAVFLSHRGDGRMLVHGDDFVLLADDEEIKVVEQLLKSNYTVKMVSVIGHGSLQQEAVILNRIVRYVPQNKSNRMAMEIEPDQRHVDILLREHSLDDFRSKGVDTPKVKKSESQVFAGLETPPSGSRRCEVKPFWD